MKVGSLYVCVKDMDRAIGFYEKFFEQSVTEMDMVYSVFDIQGFRYGLFAYEKMGELHAYGNNCLPSVELKNLEALKNKVQGLKMVFPLKRIGKNWVTEIEDSEGNRIEITAPL